MKLSQVQKILLIASSLWFFGEGLMGPLFAIFAEKIGGDLLDITWAWALYLVLSGILYMLFGKLLRNSPHREKAMVLGYALNTVLTFGYLLVHNSTHLFLLQIGFAFAESISTPVWDSIFASELDEAGDSFFWGIANGHTHLLTGIAVAIGGLVTYYISFDVLFIIMGCIQAVSTIVQAKLLFIKRDRNL